MPSLRFANPELQARFLAGLKQLPFELQIAEDSSVVCTEEQWPVVNDVAHKVRDACFKWYFSWCNTEEGTRELADHLRSNGLRYEIEHHGDRLVFLLPKSDTEHGSNPAYCEGKDDGHFIKNEVGNIAVTANFKDADGSESHTVVIDLVAGFAYDIAGTARS